MAASALRRSIPACWSSRRVWIAGRRVPGALARRSRFTVLVVVGAVGQHATIPVIFSSNSSNYHNISTILQVSSLSGGLGRGCSTAVEQIPAEQNSRCHWFDTVWVLDFSFSVLSLPFISRVWNLILDTLLMTC